MLGLELCETRQFLCSKHYYTGTSTPQQFTAFEGEIIKIVCTFEVDIIKIVCTFEGEIIN